MVDHDSGSSRGWVWDDTRAFLAVARKGTLSGAASALQLSIATLSRRIERLEHTLGLPLFVRTQAGYQLTADGRDMVASAEAMEAAAGAFVVGATRQREISGRVRLATAENLATELILPALPDFHRQYPGITLELVTDIPTVNLHRRDADLALRMVRPERGNVTLRRLGVLGYGVYASQGYAAQRSVEAGLTADAIIGWDDAYSHLPAAQWCQQALQGRPPILTTTSVATQVAAAKAGLGLAVLPHIVARSAGLVCLEQATGVEQPLYLVIQSDLAQSRRTRAVADFISELVSSHEQCLKGMVRRE